MTDIVTPDTTATETAARITLIGAPLQDGASRRGCRMGPEALRTAGLGEALAELGCDVEDTGDLAPEPTDDVSAAALAALEARAARPMAGWRTVAGMARAVARAGVAARAAGRVPIVMGGDHSLAMGSVAAAAAAARAEGRALIVLWLDAHPDFNTPATSPSGALHGMALACACGLPGFEGLYGDAPSGPMDPSAIHMFGIRSVDPGERRLLVEHGVVVRDMRAIDEHGVAAFMRAALTEAEARDARVHLSLDVDFLDPDIAPGVGTTVPGGATVREAHLLMEMIHDSGRVASVDLVELNPFLDERGRSARLLVDLAASLFGRRVMDRPTKSRWSV